MTESYRNEPGRGNQILTNIIIAVVAAVLGGGVATFSWFAKGWFTNQLELVVLQDTMKRVVKTNEEIIVSFKDFSDRMEELENVGNQVPRLEERTAALEALSKKTEEQIKGLSDRMQFFHSEDGGTARKTIDEWVEEYEKRHRKKREDGKSRGQFNDDWDGSFKSFRQKEW